MDWLLFESAWWVIPDRRVGTLHLSERFEILDILPPRLDFAPELGDQ